MGLIIEGISFLVVDDNDHMRRLVRLILHSMGVDEVYEAHDGADAVSQMRQVAPDIVITDWMMQPMNGLELTEFIRKSPESPNRFMPIIMMTGFAEREQVFKARDTGVTEFLVKPLSAVSLFSRVEAIVEKPRPFVHVGEYFGPDRRRRKDEYSGQERRGQAPTPTPIPPQHVMTQEAINALFNP